MRYFKLDFEPTSEQLSSIDARVIDGTSLGEVGSFYLVFDEERYTQPEWLSGEEIGMPGEHPRHPYCGELI
jgi:hypothetical protein